MCLFHYSPWMERPLHEAGTTIFGRADADHQWLAYALRVDPLGAVSVVVPLPVRRGTAATEIELHSLRDFSELFGSLQKTFPRERVLRREGARGPRSATPEPEVQYLGDYAVSVAMTAAELSRLRPDLAVSPDLLSGRPAYADYAFVVLGLRPGRRVVLDAASSWKPVEHHAVAIRFPSRFQRTIFMPTLVAANGDLPSSARYDHLLFCQTSSNRQPAAGWERSERPVGRRVEKQPVRIVDPSLYLFRRSIRGTLPNEDMILSDQP